MNAAWFILALVLNHEMISVANALSAFKMKDPMAGMAQANSFVPTVGGATLENIAIPTFVMNLGGNEDQTVPKTSSCPCTKVNTNSLLRTNRELSFIQVDCEGNDCSVESSSNKDDETLRDAVCGTKISEKDEKHYKTTLGNLQKMLVNYDTSRRAVLKTEETNEQTAIVKILKSFMIIPEMLNPIQTIWESGCLALALDILVSFIPIIGACKDLYEVLMGRNLFTGEELSFFDRAFSAFSAAIGIVSVGVSLVNGVAKLGNTFTKLLKVLKQKKTALKRLKNPEAPKKAIESVNKMIAMSKKAEKTVRKPKSVEAIKKISVSKKAKKSASAENVIKSSTKKLARRKNYHENPRNLQEEVAMTNVKSLDNKVFEEAAANGNKIKVPRKLEIFKGPVDGFENGNKIKARKFKNIDENLQLIMKDMKDGNFEHWDKWQYTTKYGENFEKQISIHFLRDPKTGKLGQTKFMDPPYGPLIMNPKLLRMRAETRVVRQTNRMLEKSGENGISSDDLPGSSANSGSESDEATSNESSGSESDEATSNESSGSESNEATSNESNEATSNESSGSESNEEDDDDDN